MDERARPMSKEHEQVLRYASSPWQFRQSALTLVTEEMRCTLPHDCKIVQLFRKTLCSPGFSGESKRSMWVLRILCANHPLVAVDSLSLLIARSKGCFGTKKVVNASSSSSLPARSRSPAVAEQSSSSSIVINTGATRIRTFLPVESFLDKRVRVLETPQKTHEFFELQDSPAESSIADMEHVLDLLECLKHFLVHAPESKLQEAVTFLVFAIEKPEGKHQRQTMQRLVLRSMGLLAYWVAKAPEKTRRCIRNEFHGSSERATGAFARVWYYNQGARKVTWLKENWLTCHAVAPDDNARVFQQYAVQGTYEQAYRTVSLRPSLVLTLEEDLLQRLEKDDDEHLVSLALTLVYQAPDKFQRVAEQLTRWKQRRRPVSSSSDERVHVFLEAVKIVLEEV